MPGTKTFTGYLLKEGMNESECAPPGLRTPTDPASSRTSWCYRFSPNREQRHPTSRHCPVNDYMYLEPVLCPVLHRLLSSHTQSPDLVPGQPFFSVEAWGSKEVHGQPKSWRWEELESGFKEQTPGSQACTYPRSAASRLRSGTFAATLM